MNPTFSLVMLSVVTGVVVSALTPTALGCQTGRRGAGNPAEVERLERERRDREMREADLRERQLLLRNMKPDARPAERPTPRLATARIREDFVRLQVLNNDLAKANSRADALDLEFVSKSAAEIRRVAARLRDNLALPGAGDAPADPGVKAAPPPAQLGQALSALDGLILRFADGLASKGVYLVDARSSAEARRELEAIIELSGWVKKASERLGKSGRRPRRGS